jgi:radical SAM superfamily enzyme YgiQ (UPF0313 family)
MAYIAAVLRKKGHHIQVIDADAHAFSPEQMKTLLKKLDYDVVATGGLATTFKFVKELCDEVKRIRPDVKIIAGGHFISPSPEVVMNSTKIDIGVLGEGEETTLELVEALDRNEGLHGIPGLVFKEGTKLIRTKSRDVIQDLDSLPFPARDLFYADEVYSKYSFSGSVFGARRTLSILTGRGCPYQCTFCSYERRARMRSVDNVLAEIEELRGRYHIEALDIQDELFILNKARATEFCEKLMRKNWNLRWMACGRVNMVDKELLKLFKRAGCVFLGYGIESGDENVLERMKKGITPEQTVSAVRWAREAGIEPGGSFILGMPGEDHTTVRNTVKLYKEINNYRNHAYEFFFATPYVGTELYDEMRSKGRITDEVGYFERLSVAGDAFNFVVNCTDELGDEELLQIKKDVEADVYRDFARKHPFLVLFRNILKYTGWHYLEKILIKIKLLGLGGFIRLCMRKVGLSPREETIVYRDLLRGSK